MPGAYCVVSGCNAEYSAYKKAGIGVSFHKFPRPIDFVSQTILSEWIRRCGTRNIDPLKNHICSNHFSPTDYERDLQNEYLGLPPKKKLKKTSVPNKNLPNVVLAVTEVNDENQLVSPEVPFGSGSENADYKIKYLELLSEFNKINQRILSYENESRIQKVTFQNKVKRLQNQVKYYRNRMQGKTHVEKGRSKMASNLLKTIFTKNQLNLLLKKKKQVRWTSEEMSIAFTLRYYSKKSYLYLKNKLHYPLPSLSSMKRWASKLSVSRGILHDILALLKLHGEEISAYEKTVVLQFDEIKIKSILEYDTANDEIIGPHSYMQVVMARGLFSNWKQPIFIDFDKKMNKDILLNVIKELHFVSYNVVACVSDCGGGNVGLWKELGVDMENSHFLHPVTKKNVYMFADAPHLLKLIRNWLLDKGFSLDENTEITKAPLINLVKITNTEINSCWKVSEKHINCERSQRQNVALAAQLLSNIVGTALLQYKNKPGMNTIECEHLGNFILDINQWFDIFNSYCEEGTVPSKNGYGRALKIQEEHLNKIKTTITNMRPIGKQAMQIFQKGMLMSIESLKMLFRDMKTELKISYICTHKLNQDSLENFFFQIRSRGPNEHPSPLIALQRIRLIILGKNPGVLEAQINTKSEIEEEYIIAQVMNKANIPVCGENMGQVQMIKPDESGSSTSFDSSNSSSTICSGDSTDSSMGETYGDAIEYIVGYLAFVFKKEYNNLGDHTYKFKSDHNYSLPSWVQKLSFGGLIKPTQEWLSIVQKWDKYFRKHHADGSLRGGPGVVQKLATKIAKVEKNYSFKIIKHFCKLRTIIRLNYRNLKHEELKKQNSLTKRKAKEDLDDSERKKSRKLLKIIK